MGSLIHSVSLILTFVHPAIPETADLRRARSLTSLTSTTSPYWRRITVNDRNKQRYGYQGRMERISSSSDQVSGDMLRRDARKLRSRSVASLGFLTTTRNMAHTVSGKQRDSQVLAGLED